MISTDRGLPPQNNLLNLWQTITQPCLSLLADECHLSINATQEALPILLEALHYQLIHTSFRPTAFAKLLSHPAVQPLDKQGFNFKYMAHIRPSVPQLSFSLFTDLRSFWAIIGVTSQRTLLNPQSLATLLHWLSFLILNSMAYLQKLMKLSLTEVSQWLLLSPSIPIDKVLIESVLLNHGSTPTQFFHSSQSELSHQTLWNHHEKILQDYQNSQPFAITPVTISTLFPASTTLSLDNSMTLPAVLNTAQPAPKPAKDIFTATTFSSHPLPKMLQKYWIAFTMGLSTVVIGGLGLVSSNNTLTPSNMPLTAPEALPHDIAIVRKTPDIAPSSTAVTTKKTSHTTAKENKNSEIPTKAKPKSLHKNPTPKSLSATPVQPSKKPKLNTSKKSANTHQTPPNKVKKTSSED